MSELNRRNRYTYASDCSLKKEQATYRIIKFPLMEFGHVHLDLPAMGRSIVLLRTDYKLPGEGDTLAASILCEALGRGTPPAIVVPCLKMDLVRHPAFSRSIALLRECSVRILHQPERYPSPLMVPRNEVLETLREIIQGNRETGGS